MLRPPDKFWDEYFRVYDVLNEVYPYKNLLETIVSKMDLHPGTTVLDAGTGTGNLAVLVNKTGATVIGVDTSTHGVKIFKEKLPHSEVVLHDISHLPCFKNNFFDYVCCVNTIFALPTNKRTDVFSEFYRVLKPGGKIIVTNLLLGYRPIKIYIDHIKTGIRQIGYIKILVNIVKLLIPTMKMFYYSKLIHKYSSESTGEIKLFSLHEQRSYLINAGFVNVSENMKVFADQAVLNTGFKVK
ncbi:MAG: class I SAM-dependent methyltransferase [Bacteroidota bacterium]